MDDRVNSRETAWGTVYIAWFIDRSRTMMLSELKQGHTATVVHVGGTGILRRRLLEMGILKGTDVYVEKYAPLKDPIELIVKGYHISLRVEEASHIAVEDVK